MEINIIDGIVALILLFFAVRSFMQGIIQEILHLASWVIAIYLTMYTYAYFMPFYTPYIESKNIVIGVAITTAFVVYLVIFYVISFIINRMLAISALSRINQTLGFLFGIGKGVLVISIVYMGLASIVQNRMPAIITDAQSEPFIRGLSNGLAQTFPKQLQDTIVAKLKQAGQAAANDPVIKNKIKQGEKAIKDSVKLESGASTLSQ